MDPVITIGHAKVVGSFGSYNDLKSSKAATVRQECDVAEIRLDLLTDKPGTNPSPWTHLGDIPLLFTARREEEGGSQSIDAKQRMDMLEAVLGDASLIDIEVASITEMSALIETLHTRKIPWIASYHDFEKLPDSSTMEQALAQAIEAGAAAFKLAAQLNSPADASRLAEFQLAGHKIPVSTMGMGALAPVSRLLCAQCGSVLNYGFIGEKPTAPGQWSARELKQAIAKLTPFEA